jgi:DnaJ domain
MAMTRSYDAIMGTGAQVFEDYYEVLQLSPNADQDTIDRVYRTLVKRYHPDNRETGHTEKFRQVVEAHRVLSDLETRARYDVQYDENRALMLKIFNDASQSDGYDGDRQIFEGVLSLLYISRRRDPNRSGMGIVQLEQMLGCPAEHLEFHMWYLREKGWVERLENGLLAITVIGIDHVMEQKNLSLRRDRLISDQTA